MGAANLALVIRIFFGWCTTQRINNAIAALKRARIAVLVLARQAGVGRSNAPGVVPVSEIIVKYFALVRTISRTAGIALRSVPDQFIAQNSHVAVAVCLDVAKADFIQTSFFCQCSKPYITRISPCHTSSRVFDNVIFIRGY